MKAVLLYAVILALTGIFCLAVGGLLLVRLVGLERRGRAVSTVVALLAVTAVEAALYPNANFVPLGLFHPSIVGISFRLTEVLIAVAVAARLVARGGPKRLGDTSLSWVLLFVWLAACTVVGMLYGNDQGEAYYQARAIVYVGGGFALASGVPVADYLGRFGLRRLLWPLSAIATAMLVATQLERYFVVSLPGVRIDSLGDIGPDAATIFVAVAFLALGMEASRDRRSPWVLVAAGPLILTAMVTVQRAAILGLVVTMACFVVALAGVTGRRRLTTTPTEVGLLGLVAVALVILSALLPATSAGTAPKVPFGDEIVDAFASEGKIQSAQARSNLWDEAFDLVGQQPVFGWGLGKTWSYYQPGPNAIVEGAGAHNIALDLLVRTGLVGLLLLVLAVGHSLSDGVRVWRYHDDRHVAAFALAATAVVVGILAKGMVESILENYRLATVLGLLLGVIRSAATSMAASPRPIAPVTSKGRPWT